MCCLATFTVCEQMTLYFENPVQFPDNNVISTNGTWHQSAPLLAIASYSQERGGFVTIFDELGEPLRDVVYPTHPVSQVTALSWHPERNVLTTGWENGEIKIWNGSDKEFTNVQGPHKAPVILLEFSEKGGRLVSCDTTGSLVGWKVDNKGQTVTSFHHDLKESITHITFRLTVRNHPDFDIEGLAKAAVNGDEHALDMFSNWRPKTTARKFRVQEGSDIHCLFVGTQTGSVYYINETGVCIEVLNTDGVPLSYMLYHPNRNVLVVMMEGLTVGQFGVDSQGQLTEMAKVKLSGRNQTIRGIGSQGFIWAGSSSLAILTGELTVRIWDIDTNDNYMLPTTINTYGTEARTQQVNEMFTCIAYCKLNQTICAGTNIGRIYFWNRKQNKYEVYDNPEDSWELQNVNTVSGTIKQVIWGSVNLRFPLLSVNCVTRVYIMKEQSLCTCVSEKIWATQKMANQVLLETEQISSLVQVELQITDMSISESYLAVTNGRMVAVYDIMQQLATSTAQTGSSFTLMGGNPRKSTITINLINTFSCDNDGIIIYGKNVIALTVTGVYVRTPNGMVSASIPATSAEGEPIGIDVTGNYLTIFTMDGFLKIYDVSQREPKLVTAVRNLYDMCNDFGEIIQAKSNSAGNKIGLTLAAANLIPDGKLYVWDIEQDNLNSYDFRKYGGIYEDGDDFTQKEDDRERDADSLDDAKLVYDKICCNRMPLSLHWDNEDPRLLVCNAKRLKIMNGDDGKGFVSLYNKQRRSSKRESKQDLQHEEHILVTMFVSSEHGISVQDIRALNVDAKFLGISTPHIIILNKLRIVREIMSDFIGLETCNKATKEAVLDFSYNLSLGNMDAAFKSIKLIQSAGVWSSLARMCVKTRRLDVASVCLGQMGNARAARALRLAIADSSLPMEAKLAVLAVQLGMLEEAEQLYIQCDRYDLLNKLYQSRNKMEAAIQIAETKDRIHLKHTEHVWARELEQEGKFKEATTHYEKANTHRYDVPRMLVDQPAKLEAYMTKSNDPELLKWWGQYIESQGNMASALRIYANAGDVYNQVRVLCFMGEETRAAELARLNSDKAAYYHMARYYETTNNVEDAVGFFTKANAYSNAVRLCKENNMVEELWNVGQVAGNREKLECARYFEDTGAFEKAVILYHRAGMLHKALDLAFKSQQFDTLQQIAIDLDTDSDPALIEKCAEYFVTNQQFDKAVDLLAVGKKYKEAIDACLKHNVQLTEDLAEKLTPEKDQVDEETRVNVLEILAESLMVQGNYHLATKKFTQAGNRMRAMKSLLKSGDTDKIIFFAGVSRQREIYIMAANYLQSLDWQNQPEILRNIITFYSKGKALDLLANFYVACAQIEIDEFQNYEKAYGALTESSRCLAKIMTPRDITQHRKATEVVQKRLTTIKRFIDIRRLFERGDIEGGNTQCKQFLISGGQELEESVRRGDVYALMIQHYVKEGNFLEAKVLIGELRQVLKSSGNVPITYYLNKELIDSLARGLGVSPAALVPPARQMSGSDDGPPDLEVDEEVED